MRHRLYAIPTKAGHWRSALMTSDRAARWQRAWNRWMMKVNNIHIIPGSGIGIDSSAEQKRPVSMRSR